MPKLLHEVIRDVLIDAKRALTTSEIAKIIAERQLWERPSDGQFPESSQIAARIKNYSLLFERKDNLIGLRVKIDDKNMRLFRLTYNTNDWVKPSGHNWKVQNQGKSDVAYELQFGFGGEEWLLNPNFTLKGYQYGYIRGVEDLTADTRLINKAYLFTIERTTSERYLVAELIHLEILRIGAAFNQGKKLFDQYHTQMVNDLKKVDADLKGFGNNFYPNVRFKLEEAKIYSEPISVPGLKGDKYNRFLPYYVDSNLLKILTESLPEDKFVFKPGIAKNTETFTRTQEAKESTVSRLHTDITNDLVNHLSPEYTVSMKNLSVEICEFGSNKADVVLKEKNNSYTIMEVKTSSNARKNIREALGQLLDYAYWYDHFKIKSLIIIAPNSLTVIEKEAFVRLKAALNVNLQYWQYRKGEKEKFSVIR